MRRLSIAFALVAAAALLALAAILGYASLERRAPLEIPRPTGPSPVGRTIADWTDQSTIDPVAPHDAKRELLVWIWYPAAPARSATVDDYVPRTMQAALAAAHRSPTLPQKLFALLTHDPSKIEDHTFRDAPVSPRRQRYPLLIMKAGGSTSVLNYSTMAEDLASHGYVVVGLDAPYRTGVVAFPDGRIIRELPENNPERYTGAELTRLGDRLLAAWVSDIGFALDRLAQLDASDPSARFTGRLDLGHVGAFGHSFGGAQAAEFCSEDARCKAAVDIDGAPLGSVVQHGMEKPFEFLFSSQGDFSTDAEVRRIYADVASMYNRLPRDARLCLSIRGASHFTFSDDGALFKSRMLRGLMHLFGKLDIDGRRQLEVTRYAVRTFFDVYLEGSAGSRIIAPSPQYPELHVVDLSASR